MKDRIRAIALDLDGTALNEQKKFSPAVKEALQEANQLGVEIIVATGRCFSSLPPELAELPCIHYVITSNGALTFGLPDKELLSIDCILPERVRQIRDLILRNQIDTEVFYDGQGYINEEYYHRILERKSIRDIAYVQNTRIRVREVCDILEDKSDRIENISLYFDDPRERERIRQELNHIPEITITSAFSYNLEMGSEYSGKRKALEKVLKILHIPAKQLIAMGDGENDSDMLQFAGIGVAMGNAPDSLKRIADAVTLSNREDGVAVAIRKFVLNKEK